MLDPRPVIEKLMAFLGERWDETMLAHAGAGSPFRDVTRFAQNPEALAVVSTASLSRWQRDLDARDRRIFKRIAGSLLIELGSEESGTGSKTPVPPLSKQITQPIFDNRSKKRAQEGSSHIASMFVAQLGTNWMSRGASPNACQATYPPVDLA